MANRKIKVLHCIRQGLIGGGESHVLDLIEHLDSSLYESIVVAFTPGAMIDRLKAQNIKTYIIPTVIPFDIRVWKKVKQVVLDNEIDIIHAHGTRAISNIFWSGKSLDVPIIYTVHGWSIHENDRGLKKNIRIWGERFLTRKASVTINVSKSNQETGHHYIPNFSSVVIKYGINLKKFDHKTQFPSIRRELNIPEDVTLIGYIVRITEQKDPFTMIRAFHRVAQKEDNIALLIVGEGDLKSRAIDLIKELKIENKVYFENFRIDIPAILQSIDIYCLPSLWEGLPIGMLEAMAMKKAVIVTAVDGAKEVIHHQENGMLINPRDYEELANAICLLHTNKDLRTHLGENAFKTIDQKFEVRKMVKEIESLYSNTLVAN